MNRTDVTGIDVLSWRNYSSELYNAEHKKFVSDIDQASKELEEQLGIEIIKHDAELKMIEEEEDGEKNYRRDIAFAIERLRLALTEGDERIEETVVLIPPIRAKNKKEAIEKYRQALIKKIKVGAL